MNTCRSCRFAAGATSRQKRICRQSGATVDAESRACGAYALSARAYLERIGNATRRLEDMSYRAQRYREMARRATGSMEAARTSGTDGGSKVAGNMDRCIDLAADIDRKAAELRRQYDAACAMIEQVQDADGREVLELRYLRGMRWEDIGRRMHYNERQVRRMHKRALLDVQRQMDAQGIR